jgi:hypothetical protein
MGSRSKTHVGRKSRKPAEPEFKMIGRPLAIGVGVGLVLALVFVIWMACFRK